MKYWKVLNNHWLHISGDYWVEACTPFTNPLTLMDAIEVESMTMEALRELYELMHSEHVKRLGANHANNNRQA